MNIDRIPDVRPDTAETPVTVKRCGNVIEVRYMRSTPCAVIEKVNADLYVDKRTGEVKEFCHSANRADSKASVAQSLRKLRDLINANLTAPETALWVTLTYKENMRDERRVYEDFRRFWQRFRYYLKKTCGIYNSSRTTRAGRMAFALPLSVPGKSSFHS